MKFKLLQLALVAAIQLCIAPTLLLAQSISITSPTKSLRFAEGDDFASSQLDNPWDFNERRDIGFEVNFQGSSVAVAGGVWRAVNELQGGYVFPLFGGYKELQAAEGLPGDRQLPRFGSKHPIDASKYKVLTARINHSARTAFAIHWNSNSSTTYFPTGAEFGSSFDGYYLDSGITHSGFNIYTFDLSTDPFEQSAGSWAGLIYALRLDPSILGGSGALTEIDWIRLVDPNSAPSIDLRWASNGIPNGSLITVWLDSDNTGFNGTPIAQYRHGVGGTSPVGHYSTRSLLTRDSGHHRFSSATLPPGSYYFYITASVQQGASVVELSRSNYSAKLEITAAPRAYFTAPTEHSGQDYALTELANPWDMENPQDVSNLIGSTIPYVLRQFSNAFFAGGYLQASADPPVASLGNIHTDAQVHLNTDAAILAPKYRYLTYRLGADETLYPTISDKVSNGWVSRAVYWNSDIVQDGGTTKAHVLYEGIHTYTMDLWDPAVLDTGLPWLTWSNIENLRIDPLETSLPTWFFLDWVTLTTENHPSKDRYTISWIVEDLDSSQFTVSLYYDTDTTGFNGQLLAERNAQSAGGHSFVWDTSRMPNGRYYPYLVVSDGSATRRVYSKVPVVVGNGAGASITTAPYDYDGDSLSDRVVYRPGAYYVLSSSGLQFAQAWGGFGFYPVDGDFDGDRKSDYAVIFDWFGQWHWYVLLSSNNSLRFQQWGSTGDLPAIADYNGDGTDEIAIFRQGYWYISYANGQQQFSGWGEAGDWPVPRDFDEDGKADLAIWRPRDGTWWILNSGYATGQSAAVYQALQWGLPGDFPVPSDYDGDGRSDFAVWRPTDGVWYLRLAKNLTQFETWQWGLYGDLPIVGTYLTPGESSFNVWRPTTGAWYHNNRSGQIAAAAWGIPGDVTPSQ